MDRAIMLGRVHRGRTREGWRDGGRCRLEVLRIGTGCGRKSH